MLMMFFYQRVDNQKKSGGMIKRKPFFFSSLTVRVPTFRLLLLLFAFFIIRFEKSVNYINKIIKKFLNDFGKKKC